MATQKLWLVSHKLANSPLHMPDDTPRFVIVVAENEAVAVATCGSEYVGGECDELNPNEMPDGGVLVEIDGPE